MEVWALMMILQFADPDTKEDQFVPIVTNYDTKEDCEAAGAYALEIVKETDIKVTWECEARQQDDSGSQEEDGSDFYEPSTEERS